jgi:hypothetical protein
VKRRPRQRRALRQHLRCDRPGRRGRLPQHRPGADDPRPRQRADTDMSLSQLPIEVIIERIERTWPEDLRSAAKAFETAEDELFQVRGRMNGVILDTHTMWDSGAGRSFTGASEQVVKGPAEVGYTLGYLARQFRAHADATDQTRAELQPFRAPNPVPGTHPYFPPTRSSSRRSTRSPSASTSPSGAFATRCSRAGSRRRSGSRYPTCPSGRSPPGGRRSSARPGVDVAGRRGQPAAVARRQQRRGGLRVRRGRQPRPGPPGRVPGGALLRVADCRGARR